jgi:hypothetical protein
MSEFNSLNVAARSYTTQLSFNAVAAMQGSAAPSASSLCVFHILLTTASVIFQQQQYRIAKTTINAVGHPRTHWPAISFSGIQFKLASGIHLHHSHMLSGAPVTK